MLQNSDGISNQIFCYLAPILISTELLIMISHRRLIKRNIDSKDRITTNCLLILLANSIFRNQDIAIRSRLSKHLLNTTDYNRNGKQQINNSYWKY